MLLAKLDIEQRALVADRLVADPSASAFGIGFTSVVAPRLPCPSSGSSHALGAETSTSRGMKGLGTQVRSSQLSWAMVSWTSPIVPWFTLWLPPPVTSKREKW